MKQSKPTVNQLAGKLQQLEALTGTLVGRANFMAKLGQQYGGDRQLYQALGYPDILTYDHYYAFYDRLDIAKAIIDRPVEATWRGDLNLLESDDDQETALEREWKQLKNKLKIKSVFERLDRLSGIGHYGVLLLGLSDVSQIQDFMLPVGPGNNELLYLKPLGEKAATIERSDEDPNSERYGLPEIYDISLINPSSDASTTLKVHYSRVIHVPGQLLENEVQGVPELRPVYNRLMDIEKIVGGSGEMFWRGARPGYQGKIDPEFTMTSEDKDNLQEQIREYEHNLRRILINEGIDLDSLSSQVADPSAHVDIQIQMISAITGIPKRILTGSERGELASSQDRDNWLDFIQKRRDEYAEFQIVREFVNRCIDYGILPAAGPDGYSVEWSDLWAKSDKDKADVGKARAEALRAYGSNPSNMDVVPPEAFYRFFLGFNDDQIQLITEQREAAINTEQLDFQQDEPDESEGD